MADSKILKTVVPIYKKYTLDTDILTTLINHWSDLPKGSPFFGILDCSGKHLIWGYIYDSQAYGKVFASFNGSATLNVILQLNGTFSKGRFNSEPV